MLATTEIVLLPDHPDYPAPTEERSEHPGRHWAEIRTVSALRAGDRKAVRGALKVNLDDEGTVDRSFSMADEYDRKELLVGRLLVKWSLPLSLPAADPAVLEGLPLEVYDALMDATTEHFRILDFGPSSTPDGPGDSSDSATSLADTSSPGSSPTPS